jgi:uncharacterized damage-inducible protein DinB
MPERTLIELLYGKGAHANPLACVDDLSSDLVGHRPENFPHSIWQLVSHMNYWMDYELKRIAGQKPAYPEHAAESWPLEPSPASESDWSSAVQQFGSLLSQLVSLAESPADVLAREVAPTHPDHLKHSSSLLAVLWQTLVHNSYHVGQIVTLRRALGAWPPRAGGDSW